MSVRAPARGRRRALGQHFLRDENVARRIVDLVAPTPRDLVVEIGPGRGALTERLARVGGHVLALEIDHALAADLRERFGGWPHVEIVEADARRFPYGRVRDRLPERSGRVLVVGNLPYSVGKPILMALVETGNAIDEMALMLQKEVAERVAASPGKKSYGALSVLTQMACETRFALSVPPGAFVPPPQVDSGVVHLRSRAAPAVVVGDLRVFSGVVRAAFSQRRKNLANAIAAGLRMPVERARVIVATAGLDPGCRAETLGLTDFARLTDALSS